MFSEIEAALNSTSKNSSSELIFVDLSKYREIHEN